MKVVWTGLKQRLRNETSNETKQKLFNSFYLTNRCDRLNIRDLKHRQRNARRRRLQPKEDWVEGFVLRLVALAMAFKNVRNLLLINHNDGFIDDDEFVLLYNLFASKKPRLSV